MSMQLYDKKSLNSGKVLSLRFREGVGTIVTDESNIHNIGTFAAGGAAPTWTQLPSGKWVLSFVAASNQYLEIPNNAALFPTGGITMKAWFKLTAVTGVFQFINGRSPGAATRTGELVIWTDGKLYFASEDGSKLANTPNAVSTGVWHSGYGTFDGANLRVYLDGVVAVGSALAAMSTTVRNLRIGDWAGSQGFGGDIGMFEIWNRPLSQAEINLDISKDRGIFGV